MKKLTGPADRFLAISTFRMAKLINKVSSFFGRKSIAPFAFSLATSFVNCVNIFDEIQSL